MTSTKSLKTTEVSLLEFSESDVTDLEDIILNKLSISEKLNVFYNSSGFFFTYQAYSWNF